MSIVQLTRVAPQNDEPSARFAHSATLIDTNLHIFGGEDKNAMWTSDFHTCNLEGEDVSKWKWKKQAQQNDIVLPRRDGHVSFSYNNKLYVFGGSTSVLRDELKHQMYVYEQGKWSNVDVSATANAPKELRKMFAAIVHKNELIVFGGRSLDDQTFFNDTVALNLDDLSWRKLSSVNGPCARAGHSMVVDSKRSRAIVFGGFSQANSTTVYYNDAYSLDLNSFTWSSLSFAGSPMTFPVARERHVSAVIADDLFIAGGYTCNNSLASRSQFMLRLNLNSLEWESVEFQVTNNNSDCTALIQSGRYGMSAVAFGANCLLLLGGRDLVESSAIIGKTYSDFFVCLVDGSSSVKSVAVASSSTWKPPVAAAKPKTPTIPPVSKQTPPSIAASASAAISKPPPLPSSPAPEIDQNSPRFRPPTKIPPRPVLIKEEEEAPTVIIEPVTIVDVPQSPVSASKAPPVPAFKPTPPPVKPALKPIIKEPEEVENSGEEEENGGDSTVAQEEEPEQEPEPVEESTVLSISVPEVPPAKPRLPPPPIGKGAPPPVPSEKPASPVSPAAAAVPPPVKPALKPAVPTKPSSKPSSPSTPTAMKPKKNAFLNVEDDLISQRLAIKPERTTLDAVSKPIRHAGRRKSNHMGKKLNSLQEDADDLELDVPDDAKFEQIQRESKQRSMSVAVVPQGGMMGGMGGMGAGAGGMRLPPFGGPQSQLAEALLKRKEGGNSGAASAASAAPPVPEKKPSPFGGLGSAAKDEVSSSGEKSPQVRHSVQPQGIGGLFGLKKAAPPAVPADKPAAKDEGVKQTSFLGVLKKKN